MSQPNTAKAAKPPNKRIDDDGNGVAETPGPMLCDNKSPVDLVWKEFVQKSILRCGRVKSVDPPAKAISKIMLLDSASGEDPA